MVHVHAKPVLAGINSMNSKEYTTVISVLEQFVLDMVVEGLDPSDKICIDLGMGRILREESIRDILGTVAWAWFEHCSKGDIGRLARCRLDYVPPFLTCAPHVQINMEIHSQLCSLLHRVNIRKVVEQACRKGRPVTEGYVQALVNAFNYCAFPALHSFYDDQLTAYYADCLQKEVIEV